MNDKYECEDCGEYYNEEDILTWESDEGEKWELCKVCAKRALKEDGGKTLD